ncbi:hypothetical protein STEG23_000525 [Scotinomys teguina]
MFCGLLVGEFRAHAAEWTANVTAEFKETRRRLSVEIYDKFQRATSVKRKLSAELAGNHSQELTPCRRTLSVNHLTSEREVLPPLLKAESIYLNGLTPRCAGEEIAVIENMNLNVSLGNELARAALNVSLGNELARALNVSLGNELAPEPIENPRTEVSEEDTVFSPVISQPPAVILSGFLYSAFHFSCIFCFTDTSRFYEVWTHTSLQGPWNFWNGRLQLQAPGLALPSAGWFSPPQFFSGNTLTGVPRSVSPDFKSIRLTLRTQSTNGAV